MESVTSSDSEKDHIGSNKILTVVNNKAIIDNTENKSWKDGVKPVLAVSLLAAPQGGYSSSDSSVRSDPYVRRRKKKKINNCNNKRDSVRISVGIQMSEDELLKGGDCDTGCEDEQGVGEDEEVVEMVDMGVQSDPLELERLAKNYGGLSQNAGNDRMMDAVNDEAESAEDCDKSIGLIPDRTNGEMDDNCDDVKNEVVEDGFKVNPDEGKSSEDCDESIGSKIEGRDVESGNESIDGAQCIQDPISARELKPLQDEVVSVNVSNDEVSSDNEDNASMEKINDNINLKDVVEDIISRNMIDSKNLGVPSPEDEKKKECTKVEQNYHKANPQIATDNSCPDKDLILKNESNPVEKNKIVDKILTEKTTRKNSTNSSDREVESFDRVAPMKITTGYRTTYALKSPPMSQSKSPANASKSVSSFNSVFSSDEEVEIEKVITVENMNKPIIHSTVDEFINDLSILNGGKNNDDEINEKIEALVNKEDVEVKQTDSDDASVISKPPTEASTSDSTSSSSDSSSSSGSESDKSGKKKKRKRKHKNKKKRVSGNIHEINDEKDLKNKHCELQEKKENYINYIDNEGQNTCDIVVKVVENLSKHSPIYSYHSSCEEELTDKKYKDPSSLCSEDIVKSEGKGKETQNSRSRKVKKIKAKRGSSSRSSSGEEDRKNKRKSRGDRSSSRSSGDEDRKNKRKSREDRSSSRSSGDENRKNKRKSRGDRSSSRSSGDEDRKNKRKSRGDRSSSRSSGDEDRKNKRKSRGYRSSSRSSGDEDRKNKRKSRGDRSSSRSSWDEDRKNKRKSRGDHSSSSGREDEDRKNKRKSRGDHSSSSRREDEDRKNKGKNRGDHSSNFSTSYDDDKESSGKDNKIKASRISDYDKLVKIKTKSVGTSSSESSSSSSDESSKIKLQDGDIKIVKHRDSVNSDVSHKDNGSNGKRSDKSSSSDDDEDIRTKLNVLKNELGRSKEHRSSSSSASDGEDVKQKLELLMSKKDYLHVVSDDEADKAEKAEIGDVLSEKIESQERPDEEYYDNEAIRKTEPIIIDVDTPCVKLASEQTVHRKAPKYKGVKENSKVEENQKSTSSRSSDSSSSESEHEAEYIVDDHAETVSGSDGPLCVENKHEYVTVQKPSLLLEDCDGNDSESSIKLDEKSTRRVRMFTRRKQTDVESVKKDKNGFDGIQDAVTSNTEYVLLPGEFEGQLVKMETLTIERNSSIISDDISMSYEAPDSEKSLPNATSERYKDKELQQKIAEIRNQLETTNDGKIRRDYYTAEELSDSEAHSDIDMQDDKAEDSDGEIVVMAFEDAAIEFDHMELEENNLKICPVIEVVRKISVSEMIDYVQIEPVLPKKDKVEDENYAEELNYDGNDTEAKIVANNKAFLQNLDAELAKKLKPDTGGNDCNVVNYVIEAIDADNDRKSQSIDDGEIPNSPSCKRANSMKCDRVDARFGVYVANKDKMKLLKKCKSFKEGCDDGCSSPRVVRRSSSLKDEVNSAVNFVESNREEIESLCSDIHGSEWSENDIGDVFNRSDIEKEVVVNNSDIGHYIAEVLNSSNTSQTGSLNSSGELKRSKTYVVNASKDIVKEGLRGCEAEGVDDEVEYGSLDRRCHSRKGSEFSESDRLVMDRFAALSKSCNELDKLDETFNSDVSLEKVDKKKKAKKDKENLKGEKESKVKKFFDNIKRGRGRKKMKKSSSVENLSKAKSMGNLDTIENDDVKPSKKGFGGLFQKGKKKNKDKQTKKNVASSEDGISEQDESKVDNIDISTACDTDIGIPVTTFPKRDDLPIGTYLVVKDLSDVSNTSYSSMKNNSLQSEGISEKIVMDDKLEDIEIDKNVLSEINISSDDQGENEIMEVAGKIGENDEMQSASYHQDINLENVIKSVTVCSADILFLIGREKDPSKSEVARLIQQSLEQDRRRAETKTRMEEEQQRLHEEIQRREQGLYDDGQSDDITGGEISSEAGTDVSSLYRDSADFMAINSRREQEPPPLPVSPPPGELGAPPPSFPQRPPLEEDDILAQLADEDTEAGGGRERDAVAAGTLVVDEFELPGTGSSSEAVTPEMDAHSLFIKLKEAQYKNAVAEAELAKFKAKMIMLENTDSQRRHYEKRCEEMSQRLRDTEKTIHSLQAEMARYQIKDTPSFERARDLLEGSQGEYIHLEQQLKSQYGTLEKKYSKAKKLIKEYQTREKEIMTERECIHQQQTEQQQQYNELVKSLKDRIFSLESNLSGALMAAGLPAASPTNPDTQDLVTPQKTVPVKKTFKPLEVDLISVISDPEDDVEAGDIKYTVIETSLSQPVNNKLMPAGTDKPDFAAVPETELLDTSANKSKGQLGTTGALAQRRPPTRRGSSGTTSSQELDEEEEDDPFVQHGSDATVLRKNHSKNKKSSIIPDEAPDYPAPAPPVDQSPYLGHRAISPGGVEAEENGVKSVTQVVFLGSEMAESRDYDDSDEDNYDDVNSDDDVEFEDSQAYENVVVVTGVGGKSNGNTMQMMLKTELESKLRSKNEKNLQNGCGGGGKYELGENEQFVTVGELIEDCAETQDRKDSYMLPYISSKAATKSQAKNTSNQKSSSSSINGKKASTQPIQGVKLMQEPVMQELKGRHRSAEPEERFLTVGKLKAVPASQARVDGYMLPAKSATKDSKAAKGSKIPTATKATDKDKKKGKKGKKGDDASDTSSIASQASGSYDPNKAEMTGAGGARESDLIPTSVDEDDGGGITLISAKTKPGSITKLFSTSSSSIPTKSGGGGGSKAGDIGGGITLLAMRPLNTEYSTDTSSSNGMLPQASTLSLDTGLRERGAGHSRESSTTTTSSTSGSGDLLEEGGAAKSQSYDFTLAKLTIGAEAGGSTSSSMGGPKKAVSTPSLAHYQSSPVNAWTTAQVCDWITAIKLPHYVDNFTEKQVDGQQLLQLDNNRIKTLGIVNAKDRDNLKKRLKELKSAMEKERKQREKEQKAREKLEKQAQKAKKKK